MASDTYDLAPNGKVPAANGTQKISEVESGTRPTPVITTPIDAVHRHERERRKPLVRLLAIAIMVISVVLIPTGMIPDVDRVTLIAVSLALVGGLAAYILNELNVEMAAVIVLLSTIALAICWEILAEAQLQGGIDLADLRLFDLFTILIVLSGMLIGRLAPIITGTATMAFTVAALLLLPHTKPLEQFWTGNDPYAMRGSFYDVILVALAIQAFIACISWLSATSVQNAIQDALRADDLEAANEQIRLQARILAEQRARWQEGIADIQQVHAAVARGQWDARATVTASELLPIAISLNLLLDRLGRLSRDQETLARVNGAAQGLAQALQQVRRGYPYVPPAYTGTPFDEILVELSYLRASGAPSASQSQPSTGVMKSTSGMLPPRGVSGPGEVRAGAARTTPLSTRSPSPSTPIEQTNNQKSLAPATENERESLSNDFDWLVWLRKQWGDECPWPRN